MIYRTSVGLDVHARSICASALDHLTGEVSQRSFAYDPAALAAWALSLEGPARCVYESGPTGFDLQRSLGAEGVECVVGAVSKMLRPSGDRVKTVGRDATFLARMLAVGNVVEVAVPTPEMEAARDLARAREDCRQDLMRARHLLSKLLLRKGIVYDGGSTWTKAHESWLSRVELPDPCERLVLEEYLEGLAREFLERHPGGIPCGELLDLPLPVSTRALRLAAGASLSEAQVEATLELAQGEGLGYLSLPGTRLKRERGRLSFGDGPAEGFADRRLDTRGETAIPELGLVIRCSTVEAPGEIHSSLNTFFFKCENICGTITCTPKRDGDRIRLAGRGCTKKLKALFAERGLSAAERARLPVLRDGKGPIAVPGFGTAERVIARAGESALRVDIIKNS